MILKSLLEENSGLIASTLEVLSGFVHRNFTLLLYFIDGFMKFISVYLFSKWCKPNPTYGM